jgi:hypothetical protein
MGGSGGGGGSAGEVSWPDDLEAAHNALMGDFSSGIVNATTALGSAQGNAPIGNAYNPSTLVADSKTSVFAYGHAVEISTPIEYWASTITDAYTRYSTIMGSHPIFVPPSPVARGVIFDQWPLISEVLNAAADIAGNWETPVLGAKSDIPLNWTDPTFTADTDIDTNLAAPGTISDAVTAYGARLSDAISSDTLPRFQAGMRDINAVQSSAFVIGAAIIEAMRVRDVANFDADLTTKLTAQQDQLLGQAYLQEDKLNAINTDSENKALIQAFLDEDKILAGNINDKNKTLSQAYLQDDKLITADSESRNKMSAQAEIQSDKILADSDKAQSLIYAEMARHGSTMIYQDADSYFKHAETSLELYKAWAGFVVDSNRIAYVMNKEERDKQFDYDAIESSWDLDQAMKAGNIIAAISGGTSYTPGPTPAQNALGGAFAGAAIGARASGGSAYGAAGGAILGGIGAYLMGR